MVLIIYRCGYRHSHLSCIGITVSNPVLSRPEWSPAIGEEQTCRYLHFSGSGDHRASAGHPEQGGPSRPASSQYWKSVWTGLPDLNKGGQNGSASSGEHNTEKSCQQQGQCGERQATFISYDWTWEREQASTSICIWGMLIWSDAPEVCLLSQQVTVKSYNPKVA